MTKKVCDACGRDGAQNKFAFRKHLDSFAVDGFVDNEGNRISRVDIEVDLCNGCYNTVVSPAVQKLKELQKKP